MILIKDIFGVRAGKIYPEVIKAGEECPDNLLDAAREAGALEVTAEQTLSDEPKRRIRKSKEP